MDSLTTKIVEMKYYKKKWTEINKISPLLKNIFTPAAILDAILNYENAQWCQLSIIQILILDIVL